MVLRRVHPYLFFMKGLLVCLLLFPFHSYSQKLKTNEFDKTRKKWRMETFPVKLKSADDIKMDVSMKAWDTSFFIQLMGSGIGTNSIDMDSKVIFLLDNDSAVTARSSAVQSIDYGNLVPTYRHEYIVSFEGLESLSRNNVKTLRKYSIGGVDDIAIEKTNAIKIRDLSNFFIGELKKGNLVPVKPIVVPPGFPGGNDVLLNFLNRNLRPFAGSVNAEGGKATIQFLVTADGDINNLQIKNSAGSSIDTELLRILKRMPKWKPAMDKGKRVDFTVTQSLRFYRSGETWKIQFAD